MEIDVGLGEAVGVAVGVDVGLSVGAAVGVGCGELVGRTNVIVRCRSVARSSPTRKVSSFSPSWRLTTIDQRPWSRPRWSGQEPWGCRARSWLLDPRFR